MHVTAFIKIKNIFFRLYAIERNIEQLSLIEMDTFRQSFIERSKPNQ